MGQVRLLIPVVLYAPRLICQYTSVEEPGLRAGPMQKHVGFCLKT
jgi:hypothetical protein